MAGQGGDVRGDAVGDVRCVLAIDLDQHPEPCRSLDQGRNGGATAFADDQVAFPVPGDRPVLGFGGSFGDVDPSGDPPTTPGSPSLPVTPCPTRPQTRT